MRKWVLGNMEKNLKYENIDGRYVIGFFDDSGWHFYCYAADEDEAIQICQKKEKKRRKRNAKA